MPETLPSALTISISPLLLSHTIIEICGDKRPSSVTIAQVGKRGGIVPGTKKKIFCDTLLLSVGLIPENELSRQSVYAIADGKVVKVIRSDNPMNIVVIIKHQSMEGSFFAIYGHIYADSEIQEEGTVTADQKIGKIKQASSPSHLHFGINTSNILSSRGVFHGSPNTADLIFQVDLC